MNDDTPNGPVASRVAAPRILDLSVGLTATGTRRETDSMGAMDVPADKY
jgi:fumarate hydratase, class II